MYLVISNIDADSIKGSFVVYLTQKTPGFNYKQYFTHAKPKLFCRTHFSIILEEQYNVFSRPQPM